MSDHNNLMDMLKLPDDNKKPVEKIEETPQENNETSQLYEIEKSVSGLTTYSPFSIDEFTKELYDKSDNKNQVYREAAVNINAYDLSSGCIREILYKLTNTPVESFADRWLPILLRSRLGQSIHEFIQDNTSQFTETEVSIKLPSIRFSGRLDGLIGPHILNEIKSCTYSDYEKIITTRKPRVADFYQAVTYKYMLESFLQEAKDPNIKIRRGSKKPALDHYDIQTIQFIYVAHDITATDVENFGEMLYRIKELKRVLKSKSNTFFFMTTMVVDVTNNIADKYIDHIRSKLQYINYYLDTNTTPSSDDPFIDKKKCYFCLYKNICDV